MSWMTHRLSRSTMFACCFGVCALLSVGCSETTSGGTGGTGGGTPPLDDTFKAATCVREITPVSEGLASAYQDTFGEAGEVNHTDPIFMAGFGTREATGYHDRLWARGVVMGGPGGRVAFVSLDVVGYFSNETETIRAMVSPDSGIDHAVISSTHQHEGPDTIGIYGPSDVVTGIDFAYLDFINGAVADCIDEAAANLEDARLRTLTSNSDGLSLGLDDRDDMLGVADGKVLEGDAEAAPVTEGRIVNSSLPVLQLTKREPNADGEYEVLGTLVNFASHPEAMGSDNTLITSDFPHYFRERLEAEYGGTAIFVSADLGVLQGPLWIDVEDPMTDAPAERRTYRWLEVHGEQLAERVIESIDPKEAGDDAPDISFALSTPLAIPLANPLFRVATATQVLNKRRSLYTDGEPDDSIVRPYPEPYEWIPLAGGEDLHTEVSALRIGDASFASVPTELDPQIGNVYRDAMTGAEHRFLIGLGNDHIGYQVPYEKWDNSCHECFPDESFCDTEDPDCSTVFENNVGQDVDPIVSEKLLELIDELH